MTLYTLLELYSLHHILYDLYSIMTAIVSSSPTPDGALHLDSSSTVAVATECGEASDSPEVSGCSNSGLIKTI